MKKSFVSILLITLSGLASMAQGFDKNKLDNYFSALEANNKFMGSVAVSGDGKVIYTKAIGFADVENNIRATDMHKYRIGSISKTFTTVLVLKAVEDKKLDLNQTIDAYFPTIKNSGKITIKQLLGHRSGIHSFTGDADYLSWNTKPMAESEMVKLIAKADSEFEPDSKAEYSNSNFVLLSYILEKTYKQPYAGLLEEYIVKPLGLTNTYYGGRTDIVNNESKSYRFTGSWKEEAETDLSIPLGAGGIVSTPGDLVKFADALFSGKLVKPESLELMQTIKDGYGIGLFRMPFDDKTGYGHTGGIDGFSSVFIHFADGNISYALTSNGANTNINDISIAVLSAVYERPYEVPAFKAFEVNAADLDKYTGTYASSQMPLKITVTRENNTLIAQATGQASFPLEATEKDIFKFDLAGIVMQFTPSEKSMLLMQGGGQYLFVK